MENKNDLMPLRIIRIAKNLSYEDMGSCFVISGKDYMDVENGKKYLDRDVLTIGLSVLGISSDDYDELELFRLEVEVSDTNERDKYKFMLIKALGMVDEKMRKDTEDLIQKHFYKNNIRKGTNK